MTTTTQTRYISQADTNKLIRAALRDAFPGIKFSVTGSGGNATDERRLDRRPRRESRRTHRTPLRGLHLRRDDRPRLPDLRERRRDPHPLRLHLRLHPPQLLRGDPRAGADRGRRRRHRPPRPQHDRRPPASLARYEELNTLRWRGAPLDGPMLVRVLSAVLADARYTEQTA